MKRTLIVTGNIFIYLWSLNLHAQQNTFSKVLYDSAEYGIQVNALLKSFDNGYFLAGDAWMDGLIMKVDSTGNTIWNRIFSIDDSDHYPSISFLSIGGTKDSCLIVAGKIYNKTSGNYDGLCVKIDSKGDTLWTRSYSSKGNYLYINSIEQTIDSGFIMAGTNYSNTEPKTSVYVAKCNLSGNLQWSKKLTAGNYNNVANSIKQTPDSNYILTGYFENNTPFATYAFLTKLSTDGSLMWSKKYNDTIKNAYYEGKDVLIGNSGFTLYLNMRFDNIAETNDSGDILWNRTIPLGWRGNKLHKTSDGGYIVISPGDFGSIVKTDSLAYVKWSGTFLMDPVDVVQSNKKEFFVVGNGPMELPARSAPYSQQIGLVQIDSSGKSQQCFYSMLGSALLEKIIVSPASFFVTSESSMSICRINVSSEKILSVDGCVRVINGSNINAIHKTAFSIFPNPSNGMFTVDIPNAQKSQLEIFNCLGQKVYQTELNSEQSHIDMENQPDGIYIYKIILSDNRIVAGKLLIAR